MPTRPKHPTLFDALQRARHAGQAWEPRASEAPAGRPPLLAGGANRHALEPGEFERTFKIDWLSYSGPDCLVHKVIDFLQDECGLGEPDAKGPGFNFYQCGLRWGTIQLSWSPDDRKKDTFLLSIPATGLDLIRESMPLHRLCRWLRNGGCKPTRVDLAIDVFGAPGTVELCQNVHQSCDDKHLVGAKNARAIVEANPRTGELLGYSVNIGKPGNDGSGRSLCVYDKGLEQGTHQPCTWQRYEVRFWSDHAPLLGEDLAADLPEHHLRHHAFGAYDYREDPHKRLRDRERVRWWADFIEGERITTVRPKRVKPTLAGVAQWIDKSVVPALRAYAVAADISVKDLLTKVVGTSTPKPSRNATYSQAFREWCAHNGIPRSLALDRVRQASRSSGTDTVVPLLIELLGLDPHEPEAVPI